ncbi:hypothetical protein SKAU_G00419180 [Synaphobranchus kaupii]|uniref:Uncharacterized protein n=1 Tax=Synaphobranchus kaupii TaxID=118154 RepID=A0A9Q1E6E1_SYNKA|nr:hypothetical protein SKAU_G00419180 [Synaphobranchus kaupii]
MQDHISTEEPSLSARSKRPGARTKAALRETNRVTGTRAPGPIKSQSESRAARPRGNRTESPLSGRCLTKTDGIKLLAWRGERRAQSASASQQEGAALSFPPAAIPAAKSPKYKRTTNPLSETKRQRRPTGSLPAITMIERSPPEVAGAQQTVVVKVTNCGSNTQQARP